MSPSLEDLPRPKIWRKLLVGAVLVVCATASATALAAFHEIAGVQGAFGHNPPIHAPVDRAAPGKPQTILLLGSDRRPKGQPGGEAGARSDTIILAHLDPGHGGTALMSLPRDLRVRIPGHGVDKLNAAYEDGGPALTVRTVRRLTGTPINHVVNVDFGGFERAINEIGCIYVDVDRRYFNDSAAYAAIDVPQGYQRLCGQKALQFARFRHEDTDLVRGVRQQEVIRATKQQASVSGLVGKRQQLERIFGRATTTDPSFKETKSLIGLGKLAVGSAGKPIREVHFTGTVGPSYVTASPRTVHALVRRLLGAAPSRAGRSPGGHSRRPPAPALQDATAAGQDQALQAIRQGAGGRLPVYFPTRLVKGSGPAGPPRAYTIHTPGGGREKAYRMVIARGRIGEYYGVQGTTWKKPPALEGDFDTVRAGRRTFEVHYDGDRVRLVAWRTSKGVYWVANTLTQSLGEAQMLAVARSTRLP